MRRYILLLADLSLTALSPVVALYIRDNLEFNGDRFEQIAPYVEINAVVAGVVLLAGGVHRDLLRHASLSDLFKVFCAVTVTIVIALSLSFCANRLDGVARSIPVIQWFVVLAALCATRIAGRAVRDRASRSRMVSGGDAVWRPQPQNVIVVGLNALTELYLGWVAEYASEQLAVVGILAEKGAELRGRQLMRHRILGDPEELGEILRQYKNHGVLISGVVLSMPVSRLSEKAQAALREVGKSGVALDFLEERFGGVTVGEQEDAAQGLLNGVSGLKGWSWPELSGKKWFFALKRAFDVVVSAFLICVLMPAAGLIALVVALDLGWPIVFWQQRLGLHGRKFRLYKFRTMASLSGRANAAVSDESRTSIVGKFLRKTRLDELPQLYNILVGEMSFIGPRPLLESEQIHMDRGRLLVRPGLTGWAQVSGGREVSAEEKVALDMSYIRNISLSQEARIVADTVRVLLTGDRRNEDRIHEAVREAILSDEAEGLHLDTDNNRLLKEYLFRIDAAEHEQAQLRDAKVCGEKGQRAA